MVNLEPEYDKFGLVKESTLNKKDPWNCRTGVANLMTSCINEFSNEDIFSIFKFMIDDMAAGDRHTKVRESILEVIC